MRYALITNTLGDDILRKRREEYSPIKIMKTILAVMLIMFLLCVVLAMCQAKGIFVMGVMEIGVITLITILIKNTIDYDLKKTKYEDFEFYKMIVRIGLLSILALIVFPIIIISNL